jgi:phosphonate transport system substrate-binding protein
MLIRFCAVVILLAVTLGVLTGGKASAQSFGLLRLRLGAVTTSDFRSTADRMEPFRAYLATRLQTPVELQVFRTGQDLVDAVAHKSIDYAIFTAATYAAAWHTCGCVEPLVASKSIDGTAGVKSILLVRADGPYQKLADLKGKVLAASNERSIAGRLVPFSEWASQGIDPAQFFGRVDTVADPDAAVLALVDRKADAALAWSTLEGEPGEGYDRGSLHDLVGRHRLDMHAVRIIWQSGLIPNGPHAVRNDLPLDVKTRLRDLLVDLIDASPEAYDAVEPTFGGGFVPIGQATYLPLLRLVTPSGHDPMQAPVPKSSAPKALVPNSSVPKG